MNNSLIIDITDNSINESSYFVFDSEDRVQTVFDPATHTDSFVKARVSPMLEIFNDTYSTSFIIISSIICGISLVIIAKGEFEKIRNRTSHTNELQ